MAGPKDILFSEKRLEGYKNMLRKNKIPFDEALVTYTDFTRSSTVKAVEDWLKLAERPDAIFSLSDRCAVYIMMELKQKKIKIPEEICVAGFGNDPMGEVIEPGLTTFNPNTLKIGETAGELFFEQILAGEDFKPKIKTIKGQVIIRESTLKHS
jgi:DNA-binding LacI/PurR family transcriptional regulator